MRIDPTLMSQVLDHLPDSVSIQDRDFTIIYQNPAIRKNAGNHIGKKCFHSYEDRDQICEGCGLQRAFETGEPALVVRSTVDAEGRTSIWENSCFPLYDRSGEIVAGVEVCRNITDRVALEGEIQERNRELGRLNHEYRTLLDHLPDFIVRYNPDLRRTYVNPAWEQAAGLGVNEVVGVPAADIPKVPRATDPEYLKALQQTFATGLAQHCAFEWENASGEQLFLEYEIIPEFDQDGQVVSVLAVGHDLTERKAAETALQRERSLLRCIIDSAGDLIFVKDRDRRYRICNKASEAFLGLPEAEQVGRNDFDFFAREMAERVQDNDRRVIEQGETLQAEEWVSYPNGHEVLLETLKAPFIGPEGKIEGLVGICRDITARNQAEEALLEQQRHAQSLLRLSKHLESTQNYQEAIAAARDEVREILGYTSLWVYLLSEDRQYLNVLDAEGPASSGILGEETVARLTVAGDPMLEEIVAAKDLVVVEDARSDPRTDKEIVAKLGNRTIINVPILLFDRHLGAFGTGTFGDQGVKVPTATERDFLAGLASHLAVTLDRIRLLDEHRRDEDALRQLNRKLRAVSDCNQVLLRAEDETALLDQICRIIREEAGYLLAWVGFVQDDGEKSIRPVSWAGRDSDYLAGIRLSWDEENETGQGPAGIAIRSGETVPIQDIASDPRMKPWRTGALLRGYRAGMALPLSGEDNQVFGVLLVYYGTPNSITPDEVELLEGLAANLAYGITVLRNRAARQDAEQRISLLSYALNSVHEAAYLIDREARFHYVNDEACRALGYCREELLDMQVFDIDPDFSEADWQRSIEERKRTGTRTFETRHRSKDGRIFPVEIFSSLLQFEGEEFSLAMVRDITERKLTEDALYFVAQRGWQNCEENFFEALAQFLGERLEMEYVVIDKLADDPEIAETLALYAKGVMVPNLRYALKGTPCENVMGKQLCVYPRNVQQLFPEDTLLAEMGVESYIGIPLWDSAGRPLGLIALMDSRPLPDENSATQLLQVVATRAAAELEQQKIEAVLRESREFLDNIVENLPNMLFVKDAVTLNFIRFNRAGEELLGYDREELLGKNDYDFFPAEIADFFTANDRRVLAGKQPLDIPEEKITLRNGEERILHTCKTPLLDSNGQAQYLLGISEDITARKRAEEQMLRSEQRLRLHREQSPLGFLEWDENFRAVEWNAACERIFGYSRDEAIGRHAGELILPEQARGPLDEIFQNLMTLRGGQHSINENVTKDGRIIICEWFNTTLVDKDGKAIGVASVCHDITEHKQAEENLRKLTQAIEQSPVSIVITDADGQIEFVNSKYCQITGYNRDEVLGQNPRILKSGETPAEEYRKLWQTISTGGVWSGEFHNLKKNGELFWEHATIAPVRNNDGEISHYVAVKEDITTRKRLQEQLRQAQKLESVGQLAGGVAHDFNNMLAVILGCADMAMKKLAPDQAPFPLLEEIVKAAESSADLTRQLLAFARKQVITPRIIDLNDTLAGMLKMLRRLLGENIDLAWLPGSEPLPVNLDPTQIDQVLVNLCVNARDAIGQSGRITIETHRCSFEASDSRTSAECLPGTYAQLVVSDNGRGMDLETRERIFEPFFTTKGIGRGTGLGLATVYGIIKQNHGFINVYSESGQGTAFKIYLPLQTPSTLQQADEEPRDVLARGEEQILLVEDEPSILSIAGQMLETCGYRVLLAATPAEAMDLAKTAADAIDLVITDVVMPGMNGRDLAFQLADHCPRAKCLYMSGYTTDVIARHGILEKGVHFIQKPFAMQALAAKVREVLDAPPEAAP